MTPQAQLGLLHLHTFVFGKGRVKTRFRGQRDLQFLLDLMAIHASHASGFVGAALPEQMRAPGMTFFANSILLCNGIGRVLTEADCDRFFGPSGLDMRASRSMARFAAPSFKRCPWMHHHLAHDGILKAPVLFVMTAHANVVAYEISVAARGGSTCLVLWVVRFRGRFIGLAQGDRSREGHKDSKQKNRAEFSR